MSTYKGTMNKVQIIGNLTADPEVRQTGNGQMVANIRLATNRGWKDQSGQQQEEAEFHSVVAWGKLAEIASKYLNKGKKVYIDGRLRTRSWEGQDGIKRYTTEIVAENLMMLSSGGGGGSNYNSNNSSSQSQANQSVDTFEGNDNAANAMQDDGDGEIPIEDLPF